MKFVNRISEQERLNKALTRPQAVFVVIYGRRRCGKSRLIRQVLQTDDLYFMADQSEASYQRSLFSKMIAGSLPGFDKVIYPDWETLFESLNHRLEKKVTLCIDEFPYLVRSAPELPSVLQKIMERKESLMYNLVLCGSSQQLMRGLVLDGSAPLFGRADEIIKIKPMAVPYLQEVLSGSAIETIEEYSVWGGVPRYWELRRSEDTLSNALTTHLFSSRGILYDEPLRLFLDDMRDTVHSFTILSLIASGCHRLSEIASRLGKPATSLSAPLDRLLQLGYIMREIPFGENYKNSKKSLYKISDPFLNFYFRFVVPNRSFIEIEQSDAVIQLVIDQFPQYVSVCWEDLCRQAVSFLNINGISFKPASRWWGSLKKGLEMEIDVLAESLDGTHLLVGECKWSDKRADTDKLVSELLEKVMLLPISKGKTIVPVLFMKRKEQTNSDHIFDPDNILDILRH